MSDLEEKIKQLRNTIFNMLNFTNVYILTLDGNLRIKFANESLARDLGFNSYEDILGMCWLDFIEEKERNLINTVYKAVSNGYLNWEEKYKEIKSTIVGKNGERYSVYWFNSHINTDYNWSFSFGVKKQSAKELTIDSVRNYYQEVVNKDRVMINSMRDVIELREKINDRKNDNIIFV